MVQSLRWCSDKPRFCSDCQPCKSSDVRKGVWPDTCSLQKKFLHATYDMKHLA